MAANVTPLVLWLLFACTTEAASRPLHIHAHMTQELTTPKLKFLTNVLVPEAIAIWSDLLQVTSDKSRQLRLARDCNSHFADTHNCPTKCHTPAPNTKCGDRVVPDEHLQSLESCQGGSSTADDDGYKWTGCVTTAEGKGAAPHTDFILYIQSEHAETCATPGRPGALAWAATCQLDPETDRPIAGFINFCPEVLAAHRDKSWQQQLSTAVHEIGHALGFSSNLMALWRHPDGTPRTARDECRYPPLLQLDDFLFPLPNAQTVHFDGHYRDGLVVTPTVVSESRNHFNCHSMQGLPLENQSPHGVWGSHWEERVLGTEIMSGTLNALVDGERISRMTLALFQDTGWYKANMQSRFVGTPAWGYHQGCAFVEQRCILDELPTHHPFCAQQGRVGCAANYRAIAKCNLQEIDSVSIPSEFQYFENPQLGGSMAMADFCPFYGTDKIDCRNSGVAPTGTLETYGEGGVACMETRGDFSTRNLPNRTTLTAGCFKFECDWFHNRFTIVLGDGTRVACPGDQEAVNVSGIPGGRIVCPPAKVLCGLA